MITKNLINRRHAILNLAAMSMMGGSSAVSSASFPSKPIRIIVPYAPGGYTDIISRAVAQKISVVLGQPVLVENKAGASTVLAAEFVAKSEPDGHTLLMAVTTTLSTNPLIFRNLPYKRMDFVPVALTGLTPYVLAMNPLVPANTLSEVIALGKSKPDMLNVGTLGIGASTHLVAAMFNMLTGLKLNMIPYKGAGPTLNDLVAGHIQIFFDGIATAVPLQRSGKLKLIAISGAERSPAAPEIPTFTESGLPGMQDTASWYGLVAPAGTPATVVNLLNRVTNEALITPDVQENIKKNGASAPILTASQFGDLLDRHNRMWEAVTKNLNISLEFGK